jgi:hypothetical protein
MAKAWVEERLAWLEEEFPDNVFTGKRIVLPTHDWFPDRHEPTERWLKVTLERVCEYMDVDPDYVAYELYDESGFPMLVNESGEYLGGTAGTFQFGDGCFVIRLEQRQLGSPIAVIGTLAHELAHARLLGEGRIDPDVYDHELTTDLTVVHLGLGIFLANLPRAWVSDMTNWPDSELRKPEYMSAPMYGWALAHLAWFRGETNPSWAAHLEWGARANLKQGIQYLFKTADSTFRPVKMR